MTSRNYPSKISFIAGFDGYLRDGSKKSQILLLNNSTYNISMQIPDEFVSLDNFQKTIKKYDLSISNNSPSFPLPKKHPLGLYFFMEIGAYNNPKKILGQKNVEKNNSELNTDSKYKLDDYYLLISRLVSPENLTKKTELLLNIVKDLAPDYYDKHMF
ncbi:MAG: hypothetical protein U9R00_01615 [Patescibacteria group bacterium]|nr:hypothetical protein [Patescibacteria group bacterium]